MHDLPCIYGVNLNSLLIVDIYKQFWYVAVWLEAVEDITTHVVLKKYFVQDFLLILKSASVLLGNLGRNIFLLLMLIRVGC